MATRQERISDGFNRLVEKLNELSGGVVSFNTVSKNLSSNDATITYNANGDVDTVVYDLGNGQSITKTINYLPNGDIDTVVLSGDTPTGVDLTKTIVYNVDGDIINITYS